MSSRRLIIPATALWLLVGMSTAVSAQENARASSGSAGASGAPATTGAYDDGFRLAEGPDGFSLKLNGFVQARYTWLDPDTAGIAQNFDLGLARVALGGDAFSGKASYFFQLEASTFGNSNRLSLLDGWIQLPLSSSATVKAGRILLPFSRQFLTHPGNLLFTDLSAADYAFNMPRAIGVHAAASVGRLTLDGAIANSVRALDGAGQQNGGGAIAGIGRAELSLLGPYGYLESSPAGSSGPRLSVGAAVHSNPVTETSAFQNVQAGDSTTGLTIDAGFRTGRTTAQAAWYARRNESPDGRLLDRGGYVQAGFYVVPSVWEIAARASFVHFEGLRAAGAAKTREYEVGANRYLHGHNVKVQADGGLVQRDRFAGSSDTDRRVRVQLQLLF
jgi:hypothetical protein